MLKSGKHLFLGVMPVETQQSDTHAGYTSAKGAAIWVVTASDGAKVTEYKLESEPVWDGMAASNGRLFVSMADGSVSCWKGGSGNSSN
jgi:hypothetical protein